MPELPEVETTRRGIEPHLLNRKVASLIIRDRRLRWPVSRRLDEELPGQTILQVKRRAKYLLIQTSGGWMILHLGMSGSLRILPAGTPVQAHDHVDIILDNGQMLRFRDPRRFGSLFWTRRDPLQHVRLKQLGPEPLGEDFTAQYLYQRSRGRKLGIKPFLMDSHTVVGVGNIYASEALFLAGIHPKTAAGRISLERYRQLAEAVRTVLAQAIEQGGTTLRDFQQSDGNPGYFAQSLNVYGRDGQACFQCGNIVQQSRQGQRSTYYCIKCQK